MRKLAVKLFEMHMRYDAFVWRMFKRVCPARAGRSWERRGGCRVIDTLDGPGLCTVCETWHRSGECPVK